MLLIGRKSEVAATSDSDLKMTSLLRRRSDVSFATQQHPSFPEVDVILKSEPEVVKNFAKILEFWRRVGFS